MLGVQGTEKASVEQRELEGEVGVGVTKVLAVIPMHPMGQWGRWGALEGSEQSRDMVLLAGEKGHRHEDGERTDRKVSYCCSPSEK